MSKGIIVHLDDKKDVLDEAKHLFDQLNSGIDYITCQTKKEFEEVIDKDLFKIRALIFDLTDETDKVEEKNENPLSGESVNFLEKLKESFASYNIPIVIYSGFLDMINGEFDDYGSVTLIEKGKESLADIFNTLILLSNSGFVDVFCPGGILETEIREELNKSFTKQFTGLSQIEDVIKSIINSNSKDKEERVKRIFKRIAVKTLSSDLLAPVTDNEEKVHPVEHFYRRQSKIKVWTGDIWKIQGEDKYVIIVTPRCDLASEKISNLLYVSVEKLNKPISLTGKPDDIEKRLRDYLTDNRPGKSSRYIPSNTFFPEGGVVNLADHHTIDKDDFLSKFEYVITLSDDFANEIIGKFVYYFLRTGISTINEQEFEVIVKSFHNSTSVEEAYAKK